MLGDKIKDYLYDIVKWDFGKDEDDFLEELEQLTESHKRCEELEEQISWNEATIGKLRKDNDGYIKILADEIEQLKEDAELGKALKLWYKKYPDVVLSYEENELIDWYRQQKGQDNDR